MISPMRLSILAFCAQHIFCSVSFAMEKSECISESRVEADASVFLKTFTEAEFDAATTTALQEKVRTAAQAGFFYLQIPETLIPSIDAAYKFAESFYKDERCRNAKFTWVSGFHDVQDAQIESLICHNVHWDFYPEEVRTCAHALAALSNKILRVFIEILLPQLPQENYGVATGGLLSGGGAPFFSFNHYRPEKKCLGVMPHKDSGFMTLLYINKPGLLAQIKGEWIPIVPLEGYLVVNLGKAFELLVHDRSKLNAAWHYVQQTARELHGERVSFACFSDNHPDSELMTVRSGGQLEALYTSYNEYLIQFVKDMNDQRPEIPDTIK